MKPYAIRLVLFDLDGTLADTAPDLAAAANRMRISRGLTPLSLEALRPAASNGARGMVRAAFGPNIDADELTALCEEFLTEYQNQLCVHTQIFPEVAQLLDALEAQNTRWGIVTNKASRFTTPLIQALHLSARAACVVSADTVARAKPHPDPLLHALATCQASAQEAIYVGDDERDIQAGRAAGIRTVAVRYGYLGTNAPIERWLADHIVDTPIEILGLLSPPQTGIHQKYCT